MLNKLPWIVVPGGPGLSNCYLKYALERMPIACKLHFYDMYGSPESNNKTPSIDEMVDQINLVSAENGLSEYGLITHSFGNYLAIRAFQKDKGSIKAIIMLNPAPFNFHAWKKALANVVAKIPESVFKEVTSLSNTNSYDAGAKLFRLIFPYYIGSRNSDLPVDVPFDVGVCNAIVDKVPEYDDKDFVSAISIPIVRIVGDLDPFFDDPEILPKRTIVIPDVGHYPFFEDPDRFYEAMKDAGKLLSQQTTE